MNKTILTLAAALTASSLAFGAITIPNLSFTYSEDFDQTSLAGGSFTNDSSIAGWYVGPGTAVVDSGFSTPRVFHDGDNFGTYTRDNRPDQFFGVQFQNTTGGSISYFEFEFDLNAVGIAANQGVVDIQIDYQVSTTEVTDITLGSYTSLVGDNTLFFTDTLQTDINYTIPSLTLGDSEYLMIRFFVDADDNGGTDLGSVQSREAFTIDNFNVVGVPEPSAAATLLGGFALGALALRRRRA